VGAEAAERDAIGRVGELERELEVELEIGVGSDAAECSELRIRSMRDFPP
jgi:hypothetical protein